MARSPAESSTSTETEESSGDFTIRCLCGTAHAGTRRRRHQQILCKECGTALFVLPLDTYPTPPKPGSKKKSGKRSGARSGEAAKNIVGQFVGRTKQRITRTIAACINAIRWAFSPIKMAIYAVVLFVIGTAWYIAHQQAIAQAETDIVSEAEAGYAALLEGDYDLAEERLAIAANAVELLERTDEPSRRIQQAAREASVLANLAPVSIVDLVRRIDDSGVDADGMWKSTERIRFEDQWIAFDATVEKRGDHHAITLPIKVGERANIYVRVDSAAFDNVSFDDGLQTVTFAGQIESVERVTTAWNVVIEPNSLFLWESPGLYRELGFMTDPVWNTPDAVANRLAIQRLWQGGEALPEDDVAGDAADLGARE